MLTIALALRVLSVSPDAWELVDEIENAMAENCDEYPADSSPIYCDPTIDRD